MRKLISIVLFLALIVGCNKKSNGEEVAVNEQKKEVYGVVTATDVNVRNKPGLKGKVIFQVDKNDTVIVYDSIFPANKEIVKKLDSIWECHYSEAILKADWKVYVKELGDTVFLPKGKAILVGYTWCEEYNKNPPEEMEDRCVEFKLHGKTYTVEGHIEEVCPSFTFIDEGDRWYKIKKGGKLGYIFGKFVRLLND